MFSDKDELGADVHGPLVSDESLTSVHVVAVELTVETKAVVFRWSQRQEVTAEVIGTACRY